jgi:serine/threonine-protein kinase
MSRLKRLIVEAHQRSLWQALVIYLGASFAVLEAADLLIERFGLPGWLFQVAFALLVVGLPVVVVASLGKEEIYGADVPEEHAEAAAEEDRRLRLLTWRTAGLSFMAALALWGVVAAGLLLFGGYGVLRTDERPSVAVLPLENRSGLEEDVYFTDGIHDEILTQLSKISGLSVRGRTSVMEYRDSPKNLRQIGEELNARYLMEGGVQRAGETVRINVQLIDSEADEHVFVDTYDRELSVENLLAVQREVALRIADALEATLTPAERERIEEMPTENLEAYEFYLQGNVYWWGEPTLRVLESAQQMYERAVEIDPQFALAYARLSGVHSYIYHMGLDRTAERLRQAEDAINRALELRPDLPEAHVALGDYYYRGFRDYERAVAALDVAEQALPGNVGLLDTKAAIAKRQGRSEEAISLLREARRLDPRWWVLCWDFAVNLSYLHRYAEAAAYYDTLLALAPDMLVARLWKARLTLYERGETDSLRSALEYLLARNYEYRGRVTSDRWYVEFFDRNHAAALDVLARAEHGAFDLQESYSPTPLLAGFVHLAVGDPEKAQASFDSARVLLEVEVQEYPEDERRVVALGLAYAGLGRKDEAIRAGLNALDLPYPKTDLIHRAPTVLALVWIHAMLGDRDVAIDQLESYLAIPSRWSAQTELRDPRFDPLRDHPRFQALLEKYQQPQH